MDWQLFTIIFMSLLGLSLGSFINVVVIRLPQGTSLFGRSACPQCEYQLRWYDLFPILSYLLLAGQCRNCTKRISAQYPIVEASTALLYALLGWWLYASPLQLGIISVYTGLLIALFLYDYKYYLLPDFLTLPGIAAGIIGSIILQVSLWSIVSAICIGGGIFLLQYLISKGRWIGGGDIRLGAMMGAMLGFPNIIAALFIAYMLGACVALPLLVRRQKNMTDALPFGTFLTAATFICLLFGQELVDWYVTTILQF